MRNTMRVILLTTSSLLLVSVLTASCISLNHHLKYTTPLKRTSAPVDAFVLVEVSQELVPGECHTTNKSVDCKKLLKTLPSIKSGGSGSGMMVTSHLGPAILTAAHVCEDEVPDSFKHKGVTISIIAIVKIRVTSPTKGTYSATVIKIDRDKDLCLLKPEKIFTHPVSIATKEPKIGDKVYSIAAPYGISGPGMALIFNGFFSGVGDSPLSPREMRFYTIPTRPGSSGAAVLNENWEVIGVLHTAFRRLENVGIGTGLEDVRSFLFSSE